MLLSSFGVGVIIVFRNVGTAVSIVVALTSSVQFESQYPSVFIDVESAYLHKDVDRFSLLLSNDFLFTSMVLIDGEIATEQSKRKDEMLAWFHNAANKKNNSIPSDKSNIEIVVIDDLNFCGISKFNSAVQLLGENYWELELRKFCFVRQDNVFKLISLHLEYSYSKPLGSPIGQ